MKLTIKKIRLNELGDFVNSQIFRDFEVVPISSIRAKSYLANPHATADDVVLYLGFIENKLVAFRSLFADTLNENTNPIRFAWCSGAWVHPNYRRKGFSGLLLKEAYADWDQKLMFTNYTPYSEKLIQKTGWFTPIHQFEGARAYLFPKTKKRFIKPNSNWFYKTFLSLIDWLIKLFSSTRLCFFRTQENPFYRFELNDTPDTKCYNSLDSNTLKYMRTEKELRWIFDNPWIASRETYTCKRYPFSSHSNAFKYYTVKVYSHANFVGFVIFSVREGHLKTLYWNLPNGTEREFAVYLKIFCKLNTIEMVSTYKKELAAELFKRNFPFLYVKKYGQKIYSTFKLKGTSEIFFQDGDGDVIFT